jgi:hypothetical protein
LPTNFTRTRRYSADAREAGRLSPKAIAAVRYIPRFAVAEIMIAQDHLRRIAIWSRELSESEIEVARSGIVEKSYRANECMFMRGGCSGLNMAASRLSTSNACAVTANSVSEAPAVGKMSRNPCATVENDAIFV